MSLMSKGRIAVVHATEGLKFDADKTRIELFPGDVLFAISDILTFGAKKYADRNWELGMNWSRPFGALMRHMWSWWQGRGPTNKSFLFGDLDPETKRSHLWHAGCCISFLIAYEMRGVGNDDRPSDIKSTADCHNAVDCQNDDGSDYVAAEWGNAAAEGC